MASDFLGTPLEDVHSGPVEPGRDTGSTVVGFVGTQDNVSLADHEMIARIRQLLGETELSRQEAAENYSLASGRLVMVCSHNQMRMAGAYRPLPQPYDFSIFAAVETPSTYPQPRLSPRESMVDAARYYLRATLALLPKVDAAFMRTEGDMVRIRAFVPEHDVDVTDALADLQDTLSEHFKGVRFDVAATAHQGRGLPRSLAQGEEQVYLRAL